MSHRERGKSFTSVSLITSPDSQSEKQPRINTKVADRPAKPWYKETNGLHWQTNKQSQITKTIPINTELEELGRFAVDKRRHGCQRCWLQLWKWQTFIDRWGRQRREKLPEKDKRGVLSCHFYLCFLLLYPGSFQPFCQRTPTPGRRRVRRDR